MRYAMISLFVFGSAIGCAQQQFTEYVGAIKTANAPTALAADSAGRLYYGTFNQTGSLFSHVRIIEEPLDLIGTPDEAGTTVVVMGGAGRINASGRGVQSLAVASDNTLFIGGDNSIASNNLWKYDYTPGEPPTFTEDATFTANVKAERPLRRSGVSIVSEAGAGLLITCGFGTESFVDYFNFQGNAVGPRLADPMLYYRDIHYISEHNIAYPFRNGSNSSAIVNSYISPINPVTGGGTINQLSLIPDGGSGGATGHSIQGGFYFAAQDQLFVCESQTFDGPAPRLRVFDINNNGTSVSLAYEIAGTDPESPFVRIYDAVVAQDHLFICGYEQTNTYNTSYIYAFRMPESSAVDEWGLY